MSLAPNVTQSAPMCSEHDLVAAVRRGDDRAFEELYSRYGRRIGAYIYGMVADHGRAEDITQEVFISALRRMRESERPIAFKPWIYEIARNACIDDFRRARRAREIPITGDDEFEHDNPRLVARAVTPDAAVESRQQLVDLRGAFRGLSETHHKIIVLRELEGLSYTQIGAEMGMSRPVVESTLFRARRRLSEEYEELVSGRRCDHVQTVMGERGSRAVRGLGIKERRLIARHLAHCQPCRRHAHLTGFDESQLQTPGVIGKIAALFPVPAFLRLRRSGAGVTTGARRAVASRAHALNALQSAQSVVNSVDPNGPLAGFGRAAAGAAALVIAGAGGGIVAGVAASSSSHRSVATGAGLGAATRSGVSGSRSAAVNTASAGTTRAAAPRGGSPARGVPSTRTPLSGNSTSGAAVRTGSGALRTPAGLLPLRRIVGPRGVTATATAASASSGSNTGPVAGGTVENVGNGLSGVTSGVTSGVGTVTSGVGDVTSGVGSVPSGVNSLLPTGPSVPVPSVSVPSPNVPGLPPPGKQTGSGHSQKGGPPQTVPVPVPDPSTVVAPLANKLGLS
jgi:RNA polymerase sigma factor (sigma-70 family)